MRCDAMLCDAVLCYAVPCYAMLCYEVAMLDVGLQFLWGDVHAQVRPWTLPPHATLIGTASAPGLHRSRPVQLYS